MDFYKSKPKVLLAVDCIIFGFDGESLKILLIKRGFEPEINKWSLMGGFVQANESPYGSATRILKELTGLEDLYMEENGVFGLPNRENSERVVSITYFALIDIHKYQENITKQYEAKWFPLNEYPTLIFDHNTMIESARHKLRGKAALYPILFELLPEKFTIPQIVSLYESVYNITVDKRNFSRKILASNLLIRQEEKDKENSKKGAYYYKLNKKVYKENIMSFLRYLPSWSMEY